MKLGLLIGKNYFYKKHYNLFIMKKIMLFIIALFASYMMCAQENEICSIINGKYTISEVVQIKDKKSSDLFANALIWVNKSFYSPKTVIQTKDKELGLITIKSIVPFTSETSSNPKDWSQWREFDMSVQVKDGRYKYVIDNIQIRWSDYWKYELSEGELKDTNIENAYKIKQVSGDWKSVEKSVFSNIIKGLKEYMSSNDNDW